MLCVHGFGANADHFRRNTPVIGQWGRAYAIDLLGYGFSDKPDPTAHPPNTIYNFETWADQLEAFIDEVLGEAPILVCNSVGGLSALVLANKVSLLGLTRLTALCLGCSLSEESTFVWLMRLMCAGAAQSAGSASAQHFVAQAALEKPESCDAPSRGTAATHVARDPTRRLFLQFPGQRQVSKDRPPGGVPQQRGSDRRAGRVRAETRAAARGSQGVSGLYQLLERASARGALCAVHCATERGAFCGRGRRGGTGRACLSSTLCTM